MHGVEFLLCEFSEEKQNHVCIRGFFSYFVLKRNIFTRSSQSLYLTDEENIDTLRPLNDCFLQQLSYYVLESGYNESELTNTQTYATISKFYN